MMTRSAPSTRFMHGARRRTQAGIVASSYRSVVRDKSRCSDSMPILGAHQSIAGGYYRAADTARQCGCDCVQLFTKNNNQWKAKELTDDEAARFQAALREAKLVHPLVNDS